MRLLGQLRGTAVKLAQVLAMEADMLPSGAAKALQPAFSAVSPMPAGLAEQIFSRSLGEPVLSAFSRFDSRPFAAASIGQVHRAVDHDGAVWAVKVQYPGVADEIASDVRVLRKIARHLPNAAYTLRVLQDLQRHLRAECDYAQEAHNTALFQALAGPDLRVPEVDWLHSADRVLTTELLPGKQVPAWLEGKPGQAAIDRAAGALSGAFAAGLGQLRCLHADANFGNFLFDDDGAVGLIDFGCVKRLPAAEARVVLDGFAALARGDLDAAAAVDARAGGLSAHDPDTDRAFVEPFRRWLAIALQAERFDFCAHEGFVSEGRKRWLTMFRNGAHVGLPASMALVGRTLFGLWRLFEHMGASVALGPPLLRAAERMD